MKQILITVLLIVATVLILATTFGFWLDKKICKNKYEAYQPQYSLFGGCKVIWKDKLTPVDIIREIN